MKNILFPTLILTVAIEGASLKHCSPHTHQDPYQITTSSNSITSQASAATNVATLPTTNRTFS